MIKKIIKSLVYLLLFPIVYFICLIKPIKFIRFCEIFSGRFGEFISQVEGYFYNKSKYKEINTALSNTFGFGGHNASLIFTKFNA